jgi:hypothetical protein
MVPKAGDIVDLHPAFKAAVYAESAAAKLGVMTCGFGEEEDGHLHVVDVTVFCGTELEVCLSGGDHTPSSPMDVRWKGSSGF